VVAWRPEVALLDWSMACEDRESIASLLHSGRCMTSIIFLTVSGNSPEKQEMLRLGARAFLSKGCSARTLRSTVWKARQGRMLLDGSLSGASSAAARCALQLTLRERQLIPLVCSGLKNKDIALRLGIAESTVWHHLTSVFTKLKVGDRLGLAAYAYGNGLVLPGQTSSWRQA
jgi:two-component system, NarL family, nitrate/nitrite response regulator NarL